MAVGLSSERYGHIEARALQRPDVTRSTMMGLPCLRLSGRFFASLDRRTGDLVVKLPAARIAELLEQGVGSPFAPSGRVFREWVSIHPRHAALWTNLVDEAMEFATNG